MKELLKSEKLLKIAFIAGIAVIALIFVSGIVGEGASSSATEEAMLEQRISDMLLAMEDITEKPYVTVKLGSDKQTVLGVTVVCTETSSSRIREKVINAVSTVLAVSESKICITT